MSNQGSSSEKDSAVRRTGFSRQDLLSQYQATDTHPQATSATPHHPSRHPNVSQPWRIQQTSRHQERFSVPSESTTISSMGNKNDSDKTPSSLVSTSASSSRDFSVTSSDRREERQSETIREGYESRTPRTSGNLGVHVEPHSSNLLRYSSSHPTTTHSLGTLPQVVPLVTPAALADMGHLYKLPVSGSSSSHLQIYSSEMFNPLHTTVSTNAPQYPSYMSPTTVKVTTVPTYTCSPYLAGYPLGYPIVAAQGTVGPNPYPTVESYSAMLASMGSQVQQAQGTRVPVSTYLPPGIIPLPYGSQLAPGIPGLGLVPKGAVQGSMPAIAYINQPLTAPDILQSGPPVLTSLVPVSGSMLGFPQRINDEPNRPIQSQESDRDQRTTPQLLKTAQEERNSRRESDTSSFQRPGFSSQQHVTRESGLHLASIHQPEPDRKPREITNIVYESINTRVSQSPELPRPVSGKQEQSTHMVERYPDVGSLVPYQHERSTNIYPTGPPMSQHSPHVRFHLSPSPQVRPTPTVTHTVTTDTPGTNIYVTSPPTSGQTTYVLQTAGHIPHQERLNVDRSAPGPSQLPISSFSNIPSYFTRGSVIQLASGELKRVEDIQTEDFIQSAEMCEGLKIDSSTVVRISEHADNGVALISFLVGEHKAQVSLEAPMEHPFFVFGQGWSAVRPERSVKSYSLGCHKLAVGDVCVSLTVRDKNGRWLYQQRQFEQPLPQQQQLQQQQQQQQLQQQQLQQQQQLIPQEQQQQQQQLQQLSPMQTMFPPRNEPPSRSPEPKRQRTLEPVQEHAVEWAHDASLQPHTSWTHGHQQYLQSDNRSVISMAVAGKITEQIDSNANMVLVPTSDTLTEDRVEKPHVKTEAKPLQPLKRRWSDPMHMAQLAAEQGKYPMSTKPSD